MQGKFLNWQSSDKLNKKEGSKIRRKIEKKEFTIYKVLYTIFQIFGIGHFFPLCLPTNKNMSYELTKILHIYILKSLEISIISTTV